MDIKDNKIKESLVSRAGESEKNRLDYFFELIKVVVISALIVAPIRYFLIQPFSVSGASMQPQFYDGEYLIVDEFTYRREEPKRGDVVVFRYPNKPSDFYIKRIVGLPGETIKIKDGKLEIYNEKNPWGLVLSEPYLKKDEITRGEMSVKINKDNFFVMGDNRQASSDSRVWGTVDKKFFIGKVWLRAWPPSRAKAFSEQTTY